ncbi:DUF2851 family protein [Snuella sp. CAU 1569]|uniref:DUF2851 family protein n=2 Tax=Snuella sedimenti TaxID=2798802 RepID=A0A8J7LUE1_9FLAO|nr:DUF2851 family protein [Snuella sedimenti]MBJ6369531.1 DUF2851 family protein [Snuella sedimenti]
MQEDFLHYLWRHKKFETTNLTTTSNEVVNVITTGVHNTNAGPDFFNAQLRIGEQVWAGNVEIHVKASDWYLHNHEQDNAYDNVILHVVWEHDTEIFRKDNTVIPTLELKHYVPIGILNKYKSLLTNKNKWINCEQDFASVDHFTLTNWLERLYFERLERKSETIEALLRSSKNDWEAVLFKMLARNFGLKVNGEAFFSLAKSVDFSVIRKVQGKQFALEALLFGQAGLLDFDVEEGYYLELKNEYQFLKRKFSLSNSKVPVQFFRLRPHNFPTIRLSQLASLYHEHQQLFSKVMALQDLDAFYELFKVAASSFWNTHYTFHKTSRTASKILTKPFMELLFINTILPLKFCYAKHNGQTVDVEIITAARRIASEKNSIVEAFNNLKTVSSSSMESQALIQLKEAYCSKNKCLQCAVGNALIIK